MTVPHIRSFLRRRESSWTFPLGESALGPRFRGDERGELTLSSRKRAPAHRGGGAVVNGGILHHVLRFRGERQEDDMTPDVRTGMPGVQLDREEFERRFLARFRDPL